MSVTSDVPTAHKKAVKHWTQTPEGKRRMGEIQKKAWRKRAKRKAKGSVTQIKSEAPFRKTLKSEIAELAKLGARLRLAELDKERRKLMYFLGIEEFKEAK